MFTSVILLLVSVFHQFSDGKQCFSCEPSKSGPKSCYYFDGSDKFVKDCPYSTMCFKKIIEIDVSEGFGSSFERGCALQTEIGEQKKVNKSYQFVHTVREVYRETCEEEERGERVTTTTRCFCRGELCNAGAGLRGAALLVALAYVLSYLWIT